MNFFIPAVDRDIESARFRFGPQLAGTDHLQHRVMTRSDLAHLREEVGTGNLLILIKERFPDFTEILFLETMVVVVWGIHGHDLLEVVGLDRLFCLLKRADHGSDRGLVDFDHRPGWNDAFCFCCSPTYEESKGDHETDDD